MKNIWRTVTTQIGRGREFFMRRENRLREAYSNVFQNRNASDEDREIVLADLRTHCGFDRVTEPPSSSEELWFQEGKRAAYARIHAYLTMGDADEHALALAARTEAATHEQYEGFR